MRSSLAKIGTDVFAELHEFTVSRLACSDAVVTRSREHLTLRLLHKALN